MRVWYTMNTIINLKLENDLGKANLNFPKQWKGYLYTSMSLNGILYSQLYLM
jgi:hypothetical protein